MRRKLMDPATMTVVGLNFYFAIYPRMAKKKTYGSICFDG